MTYAQYYRKITKVVVLMDEGDYKAAEKILKNINPETDIDPEIPDEFKSYRPETIVKEYKRMLEEVKLKVIFLAKDIQA